MRSKSEVIIANILAKNNEHLLYKYERPLEVVIAGHTQTIHPDFTIINIHTGKITYWEHAGRMDDAHRKIDQIFTELSTCIQDVAQR